MFKDTKFRKASTVFIAACLLTIAQLASAEPISFDFNNGNSGTSSGGGSISYDTLQSALSIEDTGSAIITTFAAEFTLWGLFDGNNGIFDLAPSNQTVTQIDNYIDGTQELSYFYSASAFAVGLTTELEINLAGIDLFSDVTSLALAPPTNSTASYFFEASQLSPIFSDGGSMTLNPSAEIDTPASVYLLLLGLLLIGFEFRKMQPAGLTGS